MTMSLSLASLRCSTSPDRLAVRRRRRSGSKRRFDLEPLENRQLLASASTMFARLIVPTADSGERTAIPTMISPDDFHMPGGRVILGFVGPGTATNPLDSSPVDIVAQQDSGARDLSVRGRR